MDWRAPALMAAAALLGLLVNGAVARWLSLRLAWVLCALLAAGAGVLLVLARTTPGFAGLGYFISALVGPGPAALGAALGTLIEFWRRRRRDAA